ncbi:DNA excision repair protein ERCC-2 [Ruminococcaceae bacterium YRB3002]|nr:DNA excision repair protein ERCC-2 [Ruminococcaceae bacterium YRB3002]
MRDLSVSVTGLARYTSRSGDLAGSGYNNVSGIEGTKLHKKIFSDLRHEYGDDIDTEYTVENDFVDSDITLHVHGRMDCLYTPSNDIPHIIEIKSFNNTKDRYEQLEQSWHVTQLKLYGAMYMFSNPDVFDVKLTLRYVSITTLQPYEKTFGMSYEEATVFFDQICLKYAGFARQLADYSDLLFSSASGFKFPYPEMRKGQALFMKSVLMSLSCKEALFVEAPTGTGKTISTLYPAVKGLLKHKYYKIFYLTAKTATREVAHKALNDMRDSGLKIRSCLLEPKESLCPLMMTCDKKFCPLCKDYYTKLNDALSELLMIDDITSKEVREIADRYAICPHELMLEAMNYCTVVIGDYNHAFSPLVTLIDEDNCDTSVVLADEAHNLNDRAREMYSATLHENTVDDMLRQFSGKNQHIEANLAKIKDYFRIIGQCMASQQSAFKILEGADENKVLRTTDWEGMRQVPRQLYPILWYTLSKLQPELDNLPQGDLRDTAMTFFFDTRFFVTCLEQYYDDSYITCTGRDDEGIFIKLNCLDASSKLNKIIRDHLGVVFFSATLSPYEYYRNILVGADADYTRSLALPSPFPPENLDIMIDSSISTAYKNRRLTAPDLVARISEELTDRTGNYMVFFPSFEYMNMILPLLEEEFKKYTSHDGITRKIICQTPQMTVQEKEAYLGAFDSVSSGLQVGFAVLGGHFGEGVDLVGDRLSGIICVGVGIPKLTPEREILSSYYGEQFGDGYAFAYRFPGWEKVLQAVGRVIRTEEDTGFALLIDERLSKPEYTMLFPEHWNI